VLKYYNPKIVTNRNKMNELSVGITRKHASPPDIVKKITEF